MTVVRHVPSADEAWHRSLLELLTTGRQVEAQSSAGANGSGTLELLHRQVLQTDLLRPVISNPARKLNYKFMAAEALWILRGQNVVEPLAKHVPGMRRFSDDGITLSGAYGPPITSQLPYVVRMLKQDPLSRQAVLTIWKPSPPDSKDKPCTIAMSFIVRKNRLYQHVFMRSSDLWLGVPYDVFSFSMVGLKVACLLNEGRQEPILPGALTITAASSHLYLRDQPRAEALLTTYSRDVQAALDQPGCPVPGYRLAPLVPERFVASAAWDDLEQDLQLVELGLEPRYWPVRP
jgi:thymidylate synthase